MELWILIHRCIKNKFSNFISLRVWQILILFPQKLGLFYRKIDKKTKTRKFVSKILPHFGKKCQKMGYFTQKSIILPQIWENPELFLDPPPSPHDHLFYFYFSVVSQEP